MAALARAELGHGGLEVFVVVPLEVSVAAVLPRAG